MRIKNINTINLAAAALNLVQQGYAVFPCRPKDKTPIVAGGFHSASKDEAKIKAWWGANPDANIGIPTGQPNSLVVLDFDKKAGGLETYAAMKGSLPATLTVCTGGGGLHLYYRYPTHGEVRNKAGLRPGMDVRGEGGYVVAPPSIHASGNPYSFIEQAEIAELPEALLAELMSPTPMQGSANADTSEAVPEGGRNNYLTQVAGILRRRGLSEEALSAALHAENEVKCEPPLPATEVEAIVKWIVKKPAEAPIPTAPNQPLPVEGFSITNDRVFAVVKKESKKGGGTEELQIPVCSRLDVVASTSDVEHQSWGKLVEFNDPMGHRHRVPIANEAMSTGSMVYRQSLADGGLNIFAATSGRDFLAEYIKNAKPYKHITCTNRVGWHRDSFVLPRRTFNKTGEEVILQGHLQASEELRQFEQKGTLEEWQQNVAALCAGNSRLEFAVSAAFAAPLLYLLEEESGGFHFKGSSSTGKTTTLRAAASVYGRGSLDGYIYSWRTTDNALEGRTLARCDCLLLLDELSQISPALAGGVAYQLANGQAKGRQRASGAQRKTAKWRTLFLSTGEIGLAEHMAQANQVAKAGQEIRMVDIPAETVMGLFEVIHEHSSPGDFAQVLSRNAQTYCGTAIVAFLEMLAADPEGAVAVVKEFRKQFLASNPLPENASGQVGRVAQRFALVAAAGELAVQWGVLTWSAGAALRGASKCFQAWVAQRGGAEDSEGIRGVNAVRAFLLSQDARFLTSDDQTYKPHNIVGFKRKGAGGFEWLIYPDAFKHELCEGLNHLSVAKALKARDFLITSKGKLTHATSVPGVKSTHVYHVTSNIFNDCLPDEGGQCGSVDLQKKLAELKAKQLPSSTPTSTPSENNVDGAKGAA